MAIIECNECGNKMSEYADVCPQCGCPNRLKQARKRAIYAEKQRVANINNTINYYYEQAAIGIGTLVISLLLGYCYNKWVITGDTINIGGLFMLFITFSWCHIIMIKFSIGFIGSFIALVMICMGMGKIFEVTPEIVQEIFFVVVLFYPLYYTVIRPIINVFKIKNEQKKL